MWNCNEEQIIALFEVTIAVMQRDTQTPAIALYLGNNSRGERSLTPSFKKFQEFSKLNMSNSMLYCPANASFHMHFAF